MEIKRNKRQSNLELLRIICMAMIVAHHFGVHSLFPAEVSGFNGFIIKTLQSGGKVGVNAFVLISGYFLVESHFKVRRIVNVIVPSIIYSVACFIFVSCLKDTPITFQQLLHQALPIRNDGYWFVTCFVALSVLSPFINKLIFALTQKQHIALIAVLAVMQVTSAFAGSWLPFSNIGWFITVYIIAAYIKLYPNRIIDSRLYTGLAVLALGLVVVLWREATAMKDIFCLCYSVSLLCFFKNLDIKSNRIINLVGRTTFGVYLIHDNKFVRPVLWNDILLTPQHASLDTFWIFAIVSVALVFIICSAIELLRLGITRLVVKLWGRATGHTVQHPDKQRALRLTKAN